MNQRRLAGHVTLALSLALLAIPAAVMLGRSLKPEEAAAPQPAMAAPVLEKIATDGFDAEDVVEIARRLAAEPYHPPGPITPGLEKLGYDQYRDIRFPPERAFWSDEPTPFRLDVLPAGSIYTTPVRVSVVEDGQVQEIEPVPGLFELAPRFPEELRDKALSISGFRLRSRLNSNSYWDEFLVFQGASYFRAVGRGQNYGLSARALALRTGEPEGEEFPNFTHFWIEKPRRNARTITIHGLLDSPSVTGAYHFEVSTGRETRMDVRYTLFPRVDLRSVGIAPLTSMFLFDPSNRSRFDDFRPRAHDSDGLMFVSSGGEEVWRHLANPATLQISAFTSEQPRAFGLMQRARLFSDFQDLEARYERRPSAWVEFPGEEEPAARGTLKLVEIPTRSEANDNIVAFWQPAQVLPAGQPYTGSYRITWTAESLVERELGRFVATRIGANMRGDRRLVVLDLAGAGRSAEDLVLDVSASAGTVFNPVVHENPAIGGLRVSFEFDPGGAQLIEFRALVREDGKPVSETWLYRWTAS
ncbi:MAG: glucan biosynthesis protein [Pseudomonadota bacterium]